MNGTLEGAGIAHVLFNHQTVDCKSSRSDSRGILIGRRNGSLALRVNHFIKPKTQAECDDPKNTGDLCMKKIDIFLATNGPRILSLTRIVVAIVFIQHGTQKLFGYPGDELRDPVNVMALVPLAGILETFGGLAILLGIFTRPIALILSAEMAVAYLTTHAGEGFWPLFNGGDLAMFYCFFFLYLAAAGPGPWSLDHKREPDFAGFLAPYQSRLLSVLRIVSAFLFIPHGSEEMIGWPWPAGEEPFEGPDFSRINGWGHLIETALGPFLLVGLFTRPIAFILSGEMAVAYFRSHQPRAFWSIVNGGEDAAFFCWTFLLFAAVGGGAWALDRFRKPSKTAEPVLTPQT
jgi:putative oxidoreductase